MIDTLIQADKTNKKRIAVFGDAMLDAWVDGHLKECQDGCPGFAARDMNFLPGGAANAAVQLNHWHAEVSLVAFLDKNPVWDKKLRKIDQQFCFASHGVSQKIRLVDGGKIVFRQDFDWIKDGMKQQEWKKIRQQTLDVLSQEHFDAVLLCDYDKGFLDESTIRKIIEHCRREDIPVVADGKRKPDVYAGAVLKVNGAYAQKFGLDVYDSCPATVVTHGPENPMIFSEEDCHDSFPQRLPVVCQNHVGAGDCFAAHLTLALAHGMPLVLAVEIAHCAARSFVQHPRPRPPWPHEVRKEFWPVDGKVLQPGDCRALRASLMSKKLIFTNGVFRWPHAGHAWLCWHARGQGDALVVALNDDHSAAKIRPGQWIMPLQERIHTMARWEGVDWIIPFHESDPCQLMAALQPDVLVKGHEYHGQKVPGDDLVSEVYFAPESPFPMHATDLLERLHAV
jgi:D-beta-D-heptose 7-phosphate kinase/D-beta-D-heptose 1-phosphate adenosyltransferase